MTMRVMPLLLLLLLLMRCVHTFIYSCNEVKLLVNTDFERTTDYACVIVHEDFGNWQQLQHIYVHDGNISLSFDKLNARKGGSPEDRNKYCVGNRWKSSWMIKTNDDFNIKDLNCTQEFSLIFRSHDPLSKYDDNIVTPRNHRSSFGVGGGSGGYGPHSHHPFVVPTTGMWIQITDCKITSRDYDSEDFPGYTPDENEEVVLWTGTNYANGPESLKVRSWRCHELPDWIVSFDSALSLVYMNIGNYGGNQSSNLTMEVKPGDKIFMFSSGLNSDVVSLEGGRQHRARFAIKDSYSDLLYPVTFESQLTFDASNNGSINLMKDWDAHQISFHNGNAKEEFISNYFEVEYAPRRKRASEIGSSNDLMLIDITIGKDGITTTTTSTTTSQTITIDAPYCNCDMVDGFPVDWKYSEIWLDIVVILDISEAMGKAALEDAGSLIESFLSDGGSTSFITTNETAPFYSRVGVITMAETPNVLYNLNMTKEDKVKGKVEIQEGFPEINLMDAFEAAIQMFSDGLKEHPERKGVRQVIYFMTDSDPRDNLNPVTQFKASTGVIMVNNFVQEGESELPGLKDLASPGYYAANNHYDDALQSLCKANCFCQPEKTAYNTKVDEAIIASGGCYHPVPAGVPFNKAMETCRRFYGTLATIHDEKKGKFVKSLMKKALKPKFWIGYQKSEDSTWQWVDESTNDYTNWGADQPSEKTTAKCAYMDMNSTTLDWGAADCLSGFPYVCEYTPCSVGFTNC